MDERQGERIAAAARALIGTRFRWHGRVPESGLDCVGLVAAAHRGAGLALPALPDRYARCGLDCDAAERWMSAAGLARGDGPARPGDVLFADMGEGQLHLMLRDGEAVIHAHAGLRRVVRGPMPDEAAVLSVWRWPSAMGG